MRLPAWISRGAIASTSILVGILFMANVALAAPGVISAKVVGSNTVIVVFSQPVSSSISDYTSFTGSLFNRSIVGFSGSGTNTITLTFNGNNFTSDANGGFTLGSSTIGLSDSTPYPTGIINVTDGQAPFLTAASVGTSTTNPNALLAKNGDVVNVSYTTNEPISSSTVTIAGHSVAGGGGNGSGPYSASYTLSTGDIQGTVPVVITLTDMAGNVSNPMRLNASFGTTPLPIINSVTSNATAPGTLKVGDMIIFTLTPNVADPNYRVSGSYNGASLGWSTGNNGATFTATYLVPSGTSNQSSTLQISGVTITDVFGNTSAPYTGSDIAKIIDANAPVLSQITSILNSTNTTPSLTFNSTESGSIRYPGDCTSNTISAISGTNTIILNPLSSGYHNNCTIVVTDSAGNASNALVVSPFNIDSTQPAPTPAPTPIVEPTATTNTAAPTVTTTTKYKFTQLLQLGTLGNSVRELQKRLTSEKVYTGPITGKVGAQTYTAIKLYQKNHKLKITGILDTATRAMLNK